MDADRRTGGGRGDALRRAESCLLLLALVACSCQPTLAASDQPDDPLGVHERGLNANYLPLNLAVFSGSTATFTCRRDANFAGEARIVWSEYVSIPGMATNISEGGRVIDAHPQSARYRINRDEGGQYDLVISDVKFADGGRYQCTDANALDREGEIRQASAQLVVIADQGEGKALNCVTTITTDAAVKEGDYVTAECRVKFQGAIAPVLHPWQGPEPFSQANASTPTEVWSGLQLFAFQTQNGGSYVSVMNFKGCAIPPIDNCAKNEPSLADSYTTPQLLVQWPPQSLYAEPLKPHDEYEVGDEIICYANANPSADYRWVNSGNDDEQFNTPSFLVQPEWVGTTQRMKCIASNMINDRQYSADLPIYVNVAAPTTASTTTVPTTTLPPVTDCGDLSGAWESTSPRGALLCLQAGIYDDIFGLNYGIVYGVQRNGTYGQWLPLFGTFADWDNSHISWTVMGSDNSHVATFVAECSQCACRGEEVLLVNSLSRARGGPPCAIPGPPEYSHQLEFRRNSCFNCPPVTAPAILRN